MPNYDENYVKNINDVVTGNFTGTQVWIIVSCILAIIGGIYIYFVFVNSKKDKYKGILAQIHDFLNFKMTIFEAVLKIVYLIAAITITFSSFAYIGTNFFKFLYILIFGNLFLRITFEVLLKLFVLAKDVSSINKKMPDKVSNTVKKTKTKKNEE